jgi:hypothetical protein
MPWENRFEVKTATQANAFRQLIAKEAMRRRNEAALLERYQFHDNVTTLDGLGTHWDGTVVRGDPAAAAATPVFEDFRSTSASAAAASADEPIQGRRALILQRNMRSTVLHEGYAYNAGTIVGTGAATYSAKASVNAKEFGKLNPESTAPRTLARLRATNDERAQTAATAARERAKTAARTEEDVSMLRARLSGLDSTGFGSHIAAEHRRNHPSANDGTSDAVADVLPTGTGKAMGDAKPARAFGLRSAFATRVPLSAAHRDELASRAREVFRPLPQPSHVTEARDRQRAASRLQEESSMLRASRLTPHLLQSGTMRGASSMSSQQQQPPYHDHQGHREDVSAMIPNASESFATADTPLGDRSRAGGGGGVEPHSARKGERLRRLEHLETQLDAARSDSDQIRRNLVELCTMVETQQQPKINTGAPRRGGGPGSSRPASSRPFGASSQPSKSRALRPGTAAAAAAVTPPWLRPK